MSDDDDFLWRVQGVNGQLELDGDDIRISRKGALGFLTQGHKGVKQIYVGDISSIQFKAAGALSNGYIQFTFQGGAEAKGGLFQATQDENSIMFRKNQQDFFEDIRDLIEERRREIRQRSAAGPSAPDLDAVSRLERLAALRDAGHLTAEEFAEQKGRILGPSVRGSRPPDTPAKRRYGRRR